MLHYILGAARTGKTTLVREKIAELSQMPGSRIFLLVPEQFTFETEKRLYEELGGERMRRVDVTSFTRLSAEAFRRYGGIAGRYANDCAKSVLMDNALEELRDMLEVYRRSSKARGFSGVMLSTVAEFKNAGVDSDTLLARAALLPPGFFREKLRETALIYRTYDMLLHRAYLDPLDDVTRAARLLRGTDFFDGAAVFFDEFKGFTANEYDMIRLLFSRAAEIWFSLCLDLRRANAHKSSVFSSTLEVYNRMSRFAREEGVKIAAPVSLERSYFDAPELVHLEKNIFSPVVEAAGEKTGAVRAVLCKNEYDEVDYVLSAIGSLVQEKGYRYDDIAVITRDLPTYRQKLEAGFAKYGIPHYDDQPASIVNAPLIRFVDSALDCAVHGFSGENVLNLLKCGVTPFSVEEVAELENYVYVWSVTGRQWTSPFTANPRGFQEAFTEEDAQALERINRVRAFAAEHLTAFREAVREASGRAICQALLALLEGMQVRETLEALIQQFYEAEDFALAQEYSRVWELLMELLDTLAVTSSEPAAEEEGSRPMRAERFQRIFGLAVSACRLGALPQAVDTVIVGSADRIRISDKRAVFVLGVNENVLPYTPVEAGVFTDREREQLSGMDIEIAKPVREQMKDERFIAYKTLTSPSEFLCLTARKADIAGSPKAPSLIFSELLRMFGSEAVTDAADVPGEFYCRSAGAAFSFLAKTYVDDTELTASLKEVLSEEPVYKKKLSSLERVLEERDFALEDPQNAQALFGRRMSLSPTRVESFYQCRFRYFLEQGLRVYPLRRAELDPLSTGSLIHKVLSEVSLRLDLREGYDQNAARGVIKQELDRYIETVMGGVRDKTSRFLYLYDRMCLSILKIVEQLHAELMESDFAPCAFEYEIAPGAEITPLRLMDEDGTEVYVSGKIDRIDSYTAKNGEKYVRIVDYKSGRKQFKLNDVLYGLNLQMLIYLHCITENGREEYADCLPAGILYMPAGEQAPSLSREAGPEETARERLKSYTMNGLLLEDREVLAAMDRSMSGLFIPVALKKDGSYTAASKNSLVTLSELGKINSYIDRLVLGMAKELHAGRIEAVPLPESCGYCQYRGVCGIGRTSRLREYALHSREEIFAEMETGKIAEQSFLT